MGIILFCLMLIVSVSLSDTATQTDWSGGGGVPGPVSDWGNTYDVASQIDDSGNILELGIVPASATVEYSVDNAYSGSFIYAEDVDGDGDIDVLGASYSSDDITWWENLIMGILWEEHTIDGDFDGANCVYATDIDGDGDIDVLGSAGLAYEITWWENTDGTGTSWNEHLIDDAYGQALAVYAADIDGDGDTDVLGGAQWSPGYITWWENMDGSGTAWYLRHIDIGFFPPVSIHAADVDGDGDIDVLGAAYVNNEMTWWENANGTGLPWIEHNINSTYIEATSIYATDVNGDGYTDVLGASSGLGCITWWENTDGTGTTWIMRQITNDFDAAQSVYATDLDGDGDTDVLGAAWGDGEITWWENTDGAGTSWAEHIVDSDFGGANCVYATDVNGDGYTDVLGSSSIIDLVSWWKVTEFCSAGYLESSILDVGQASVWESCSNNRYQPSGTSLGFQFRSSQDPGNMGAWSDTLFGTTINLTGILADSTEFVQYKVILQTSDPQKSPAVGVITVSYSEYVGIQDPSSGPASDWSLAPAANPSFGGLAVLVSVPQQERVNLVVHDITGRIITRFSQELPGGSHYITFSSLPGGLYFCTMHAGDFTATERVVVLD
jgi:hypothetical protein